MGRESLEYYLSFDTWNQVNYTFIYLLSYFYFFSYLFHVCIQFSSAVQLGHDTNWLEETQIFSV